MSTVGRYGSVPVRSPWTGRAGLWSGGRCRSKASPGRARREDGGRAIGEASSTVTPERPQQRDVWHVLHRWKPIQARRDHRGERLEQQAPVVARQAARLAAGKGLRGKRPKSAVGAHAAPLTQARYVADSLRSLSSELHRLLEVVVLASHPGPGVVSSSVRQ